MSLRLLFAAVVSAAFAGCQPAGETRFQGYVEGEPVLVAAQQGGQLTALLIERGDTVARGTPLFSQDEAIEAAGVDQARAQLAQAEAQAANLASGRRPPEIAAVQAQLDDAEARRKLSADELARQQALAARGFVSAEAVDRARTQLQRDTANVTEMRAQLATARLPGREAERAGAQAQVAASKATLAERSVVRGQKSQMAPVGGVVQDVFYRAGEWAAPGQPVVAILPAENIKVRFFVPEPRLAEVRAGRTVAVHCDGCGAPIAAVVRFVSASAEYTPPVLFSEKNRHRLVFMVEAWPAPKDAVRLHPGLPVDVSLAASGR
jgi:HlyD family secretion protein